MEYCYIFEYATGEIYECLIPDYVEDVEYYLENKYGIKSNSISFMVTQTKQEIQTLEPIK